MELPASLLMDTSYIIALENRGDEHHAAARRLERQCIERRVELVLHWGIVLEVLDGFARFSRRDKGLRLAERFKAQDYGVYELTQTLGNEALEWYSNRPDKEWGLTDCVSFVLMSQLGISEALTADRHFVQAGFRALLLEESEDDKGV
ncbi:MAG: PIN domain-containing protein [Pirellulales bacterium]